VLGGRGSDVRPICTGRKRNVRPICTGERPRGGGSEPRRAAVWRRCSIPTRFEAPGAAQNRAGASIAPPIESLGGKKRAQTTASRQHMRTRGSHRAEWHTGALPAPPRGTLRSPPPPRAPLCPRMRRPPARLRQRTPVASTGRARSGQPGAPRRAARAPRLARAPGRTWRIASIPLPPRAEAARRPRRLLRRRRRSAEPSPAQTPRRPPPQTAATWGRRRSVRWQRLLRTASFV